MNGPTARPEYGPQYNGMTPDSKMTQFESGDRVRLEGHWEFADGIVGTITEPPDIFEDLSPGEWQGCRRMFSSGDRFYVFYYVAFDEPHDDGSGDGPYSGAEIDPESLRMLKA